MKKLISTQIIFRHGSRTPLFTLSDIVQEHNMERATGADPLGYAGIYYDTNELLKPHPIVKKTNVRLHKLKGEEFTKSITDWYSLQGRDLNARLTGGAEMGVLTTIGHQQLYDLGKRIGAELLKQEEYIKSLKQKRSYRVRSTYYERTISSAKSFMTGFLVALGEEISSTTIDIEVDNVFDDILFPNGHFTQCLNRSVNEYYKSLENNHTFSVCKNKWLQLLGIPEYENGLLELTDEPSTRIPLELPMSKELRDLYIETNEFLTEELVSIYRGNLSMDDFIKLAVGRLLLLLKTNLLNTIDQGQQFDHHHPSFYVYAAHDTTLCVLSSALDLYVRRWPWFGSYLMLQLFADKSKFYVRVTYNDDIRRSEDQKVVVEMLLTEFIAQLDKYAINDHLTKELDERLLKEIYGNGKQVSGST
ncbi:hypothetical protein ACOME3_003985 [Neoechinorhynchus agilis]